MKFGKKLLAILLAAAIAAGAAMVAGANDGGQIVDEIHYTEAVELFSNLEIEQAKVLDVLGGSDLDGKAAQTLTYNEGVELINALHTDGRTWSRKPMDSNLTVGQFIGLVDKLLCTEEWFTGYEYYKVYLCKYMAGFEQGYEQIKDRAVSREEAVQILMNAMSAKVQYGVTWFLASEYGLTWETSMDGDLTDEWNRPVRRWLKNGTPITEWHTMPALVVDDASLCTHDMLERAGLLDFSQDGGFEYNPWCMFDICANGGVTWDAGKLHWNHEGGRESCYSNWLTKRPGSRLEVYYMGEGRRNIPDAGGFTDCQVYQAIIIDEYLAYCTGGNARVFVSENESWNLYDTSLRSCYGYWLLHVDFNGDPTGNHVSLVPVAKAEGFISPQKGMEIPSGDGNNYVYTELGKFELSNYCACGLSRFINNMDYYYSQEPVVFLLDSTDHVIGAIEVPEDEVEFSGSAKPMTDAEKKLLAEKKHQQEIDKAVRYLLANGIMFGRPESFDRDAKVTNAMVWAVLARMSGYRPTEDGSTWYSFYQHWAVTKCISDGKDPNGAVTREAFIKMVYNAAKAKEVSEIPDLNDYGEVSRDAQAAVRWAAHHGVIPAKGNSFKPKSALTRGEMALMLVAADKCL